MTAAQTIADLGYPLFPLTPGSKKPLKNTRGVLDAKPQFPADIELWLGNNINLGLATTGLLVVDVDGGSENAWYAGLTEGQRSELMAAPTQATPSGGLHFIFRQPAGQLHRNTAGKIAAQVDTRADGGYIVIAPSKTSAGEYQWIYDLDVPADKLTEPPQFVLDALANAKTSTSIPSATVNGNVAGGVSRQEVIDRAWGYIRACPDAISGNKGHDVTLRAACECFRFGCTPAEALAVMAQYNAEKCKPAWTDEELQHKIDSAFAKVAAAGEFNTKVAGDPRVDLSGLIASPAPAVAQVDEEDDEDDSDELDRYGDPGRIPQDVIDGMPPIMRLYYDWIINTAGMRLPEATIAAVLSGLSTAYGQKLKCIDWGTRCNLYCLTLAGSGGGKDHPRTCTRRLFRAAGFEAEAIGPERIGSHSGLINRLDAYPRQLLQLDEYGRMMALMKNPRSHQFQVATVMMELFTKSKDTYSTDCYADLKKQKELDQPHIVINATSSPEAFYSNVNDNTSVDGFLGRLMLFDSPRAEEVYLPSECDPPEPLIEHVKNWWHRQTSITHHPNPIAVDKTPEARERHQSHCAAIAARHRANNESDRVESIWSRSGEKVGKLAMIYAAANMPLNADKADVDRFHPVVDMAAENWAIKLANYLTRKILFAIASNMIEGLFDEQKRKVWRAIGADKKGVTRSHIQRRVGINKRDLDAVLTDLLSSGAARNVPRDDNRPCRIARARQSYKAL